MRFGSLAETATVADRNKSFSRSDSTSHEEGSLVSRLSSSLVVTTILVVLLLPLVSVAADTGRTNQAWQRSPENKKIQQITGALVLGQRVSRCSSLKAKNTPQQYHPLQACQSDYDCPTGFFCSGNGQCMDRCATIYCAPGTHCVTGQGCVPDQPSGCNEGDVKVLETCPDGSLKSWQVCGMGRWTYLTQDCPVTPTCSGDYECPAGQTCSNGQCVDKCSLMYCPYGCSNGQCECPGGQYWNGAQCVCPSGQEWNGQQCVAIRVCSEGAVNVLETCSDGYTWRHRQVCRNNAWHDEYQDCPPPPPVCSEGSVRNVVKCPDGANWTQREVCRNNKWVPEYQTCPLVCSEGAVQVLETCADGSWKRRQVCRNNAWSDEYQQCPTPFVCNEGAIRNEAKCPDGVNWKQREVCRNNAWVNEYQRCPTQLPDMVIDDISWTPEQPLEEQRMHLVVRFSNRGSGSSTAVHYNCFYIDGVEVERDSVGPTDPGSTGHINEFDWTATVGRHTVRAVADCTNVINESNENNNVREETFDVGTAQPQTVKVWIKSVEDQYWNNWNPSTNDLGVPLEKVKWTFHGQAYDAIHVGTAYQIEADLGTEIELTAGSLSGWNFGRWNWYGDSYYHTSPTWDTTVMGIKPDGYDEYFVAALYVSTPKPVELPDLAILNIATDPGTPRPKDVVRFFVTVKNQGNESASQSEIELGVDGGFLLHDILDVQTLAAGQSVTVVAENTWIAIGGQHSICARADAQNSVAESNENNNDFCTTISIKTEPSGYSPPVDGFEFTNDGFVSYAHTVPTVTLDEIRRALDGEEVPEGMISAIAWSAVILAKKWIPYDGYCYGMARSSSEYFESGTHAFGAFDLDTATPSDTIISNQLKIVRYLKGLAMTIGSAPDNNNIELPKILSSVSPTSPQIVLLLPDRGYVGHAVVAYSVEKSGDKTIIYVYDPNHPGQSQKITVRGDNTIFYDGGNAGADGPYARLGYDEPIGAFIGNLVERFKKLVGVVVHSPVDLALVDENGRYVGVKDGVFSQGFPATYLSDGENKIVIVTDNLQSRYNVVLTGTSNGQFTLESFGLVNDKPSHSAVQGDAAQGQVVTFDLAIQSSGDLVMQVAEKGPRMVSFKLRLLDWDSNLPIPNASVWFDGSYVGVTDSNGSIVIGILYPPEEHTYRVAAPGYRGESGTIDFGPKMTDRQLDTYWHLKSISRPYYDALLFTGAAAVPIGVCIAVLALKQRRRRTN